MNLLADRAIRTMPRGGFLSAMCRLTPETMSRAVSSGQGAVNHHQLAAKGGRIRLARNFCR